ncbi:MAG: hypothetical protein IKV30_06150 [Clostridia bacterium]|nr:hypothetical protein [Clostridia bacterium]
MKFLRGVLKFFAVCLALILSIVLLVTQIALMSLQAASSLATENNIKSMIQSIIPIITNGISDASTVIEVPEHHYLADGDETTVQIYFDGENYYYIIDGEMVPMDMSGVDMENGIISVPVDPDFESSTTDNDNTSSDLSAIEQLLESFTKSFENLSEDKKAQMETDLENLDVEAIIEGLTGEKVDEMKDEDVTGMLATSLMNLESVQNLIAEIGANAFDSIINDSTNDVISADSITNLFSNIADEIKSKTGVELPKTLVDIANQTMEDNKDAIIESVNGIVQDEEFLGSILGADSNSQASLESIKQTINTLKLILGVKTRLFILCAVILLELIIFFLFFKSKAGLIWNAVVTFIASTPILLIGIGLSNVESLANSIPDLEGLAYMADLFKVLGGQFIKVSLIGYAVFIALIVLFVVLKKVAKKKLAAKAAAEEAQIAEAVESTENCECEESCQCEETEPATVAEEEPVVTVEE